MLAVRVRPRLLPTPGVSPLHRRLISVWTGVPEIVVATGGSGVQKQTSPPTPNCLRTTAPIPSYPAPAARPSSPSAPLLWRSAPTAISPIVGVLVLMVLLRLLLLLLVRLLMVLLLLLVLLSTSVVVPSVLPPSVSSTSPAIVEYSHCPELHRQQRGRVPSRSSAPAPWTSPSPRTRRTPHLQGLCMPTVRW